MRPATNVIAIYIASAFKLLTGKVNVEIEVKDYGVIDLELDADTAPITVTNFVNLGKGWDTHVKNLKKAGYEVNHIKFAPDYIEEICKYDIQITPIAIGTGTKGKVLDALANGLLVIGTPYAMENIAIKHGESCIEYKHPQEVIDVLMDIPKNLKKYEKMACAGREAILKYHGRSLISQTLFSIFKKQQFYKDV